jgi:hypothetical protein
LRHWKKKYPVFLRIQDGYLGGLQKMTNNAEQGAKQIAKKMALQCEYEFGLLTIILNII